jgi:hypothetical protein
MADQYGFFPLTSPSDELTVVETSYGPMEKWKARALAVGWLQRAIDTIRSDAAGIDSGRAGEEKAPPLVADAIKVAAMSKMDLLQRVSDDLAELHRRMDELEAASDEEERQAQCAEALSLTERIADAAPEELLKMLPDRFTLPDRTDQVLN